MEPIRIQRKRTKGWRMPPNTVYVGRPTIFGNPFKLIYDKGNDAWKLIDVTSDDIIFASSSKDDVTEAAIGEYGNWFLRQPHWWKEHIIKNLKGKNLACFCTLDKPCHADILLKLANEL